MNRPTNIRKCNLCSGLLHLHFAETYSWAAPSDREFHCCKTIPKRGKIYTTMRFEFDPKKSKSNKTKHGIDFREAQKLWNDPELLEIPARTVDEPRFLVIGRLKDTHWSAVITYRGESVRIISVRRSRPEEIAIYESARIRQKV